MRRNIFYSLFSFGAIFFIFRNWFISHEIIGGDWPYYYYEFLKGFSLRPILWVSWLGNGTGGVNPLLGLGTFASSLIVPFTQWLHLPWTVVYKIGWFGLFLILCIVSSRQLLKVVLPQLSAASLAIGSLIYTTNTYILMVTGGGQMGVAVAYAVAPLVMARWLVMIRAQNDRARVTAILLAGAVLAVQLALDPRIAYITLLGISVYMFVSLFCQTKSSFWQSAMISMLACLVAGAMSLLLNAFWLLPMVTLRSSPLESLGSAYTSTEAVKFFSFADFSHALTILHPNWPENIFGKIYFLQPEFLVIPLTAFAGLLTIKRGHKVYIGFFSFLALIGVFLAKGANEPFGLVYLWLFDHMPGFVMFRDPTKFYLLIIISYMVLISYGMSVLSRRIPSLVLCILFVIVWGIFLHPAVLGQLGGTFGVHKVPSEYGKLREFLTSQPGFFRTLWVPRAQRFAFARLDHMAAEAQPLLGASNAAELVAALNKSETQGRLDAVGVKYLIIPYDAMGELFLSDRKYDSWQRQQWEAALDSILWLKKIQTGQLTIYETPTHKDHFWLETGEPVSYTMVNPGKYQVQFVTATPTTLHFSESFHPGWIASAPRIKVSSARTAYGLNSFSIEKPGAYTLTVSFAPQRFVDWGLLVSDITLLGTSILFILNKDQFGTT